MNYRERGQTASCPNGELLEPATLGGQTPYDADLSGVGVWDERVQLPVLLSLAAARCRVYVQW